MKPKYNLATTGSKLEAGSLTYRGRAGGARETPSLAYAWKRSKFDLLFVVCCDKIEFMK